MTYVLFARMLKKDCSDSLDACFTGANPNDLFQIDDEDLSIADLPRTCHVGDRLDDLFRDGIVYCQLDLRLRQEVDAVLGTSIQLGVTALTSEALDFGHRDALNTDIRDGLTDVIQLERLDDRGNQLHCTTAPVFGSARSVESS